jgi:hypothetical protein
MASVSGLLIQSTVGWSDRVDDYHFEGDPAIDSTRRQLERVMKGEPPRRRWPWIAAAVAGGVAFAWWRLRRAPTDAASARTEPRSPARRQS